jgi:hypothetical protein
MHHSLFLKIALGLMLFTYLAVAAWAHRSGRSVRKSLPPLAGPAVIFFFEAPSVFDLPIPIAVPFYLAAAASLVVLLRSLWSAPPKDESGHAG